MEKPVIRVRSLSGSELDQAAHQFLKKFDPEALERPKAFDIDSFFLHQLEDLTGVRPSIKRLPKGIEGKTSSKNMTCTISEDLVCDSTTAGQRRRRSTITHECFHAIEHVPQVRAQNPDWEFEFYRDHEFDFLRNGFSLHQTADPEWQAWRWSSYVLMPTTTFLEAVKKRNTIKMLAEIFEVNPAFIEVRCRVLGIKYTERGTCKVPRSVPLLAGFGV